jgi:type IV pilus assembly protein PilA
MIVVVIIGLLAALAIPAFQKVRVSSENSRFINDLRQFRDALSQCVLETGDMDQGSGSGTVAAQLQDYLNVGKWEEGTPVGGLWDVEYNKSGVTLGIGVHNPTVPASQIAQIDKSFDNGDVNSGSMRFIASGRYYWVMIE